MSAARQYAFGRYLLFGFRKYYPEGGMDDLMGSFDKLKDVRTAIKEDDFSDYYHVFDTKNRRVLSVTSRGYRNR